MVFLIINMTNRQDLNVLFVFGPHGNAEDANRYIEIIKAFNPHIHSLEIPGFNASRTDIKRDICAHIDSQAYAFPEIKECLRQLYDGTVEAGIIPKVLEDRLTEGEQEHIREVAINRYPLLQIFGLNGKDSQLSTIIDAGHGFGLHEITAVTSLYRERRLAANLVLGEYLNELAEVGVDLRGEDEIRIACTMGTAHEPAYNEVILAFEAFKGAGVELPFGKVMPYEVLCEDGQVYADSNVDFLVGTKPLSQHELSEKDYAYKGQRLTTAREKPFDPQKYVPISS